ARAWSTPKAKPNRMPWVTANTARSGSVGGSCGRGSKRMAPPTIRRYRANTPTPRTNPDRAALPVHHRVPCRPRAKPARVTAASDQTKRTPVTSAHSRYTPPWSSPRNSPQDNAPGQVPQPAPVPAPGARPLDGVELAGHDGRRHQRQVHQQVQSARAELFRRLHAPVGDRALAPLQPQGPQRIDDGRPRDQGQHDD